MNTTPFSNLHFTATTGEGALVLHGGRSAGNAWEIGVIAGLFDAGLDVTEADLIIGTSAGSTAAAQISSATRPAELLARILAAAPPARPPRCRAPSPPPPRHGLVRSDPAVDVSRIGRRRTTWKGRAESSPP